MRNCLINHIDQKIFLIVIMAIFSSCSSTTDIISSKGDGSIASLEKIDIRREQQWLLIRGENKSNPLILYLHGGPGVPEMPFIRHFNSELERHFIVVQWEQCGAGKSFHRNIAENRMKIDQFVKDAHELTLYLLNRFHKDKLILVGHSWGTIIGIHLIQQYPEFYEAYVGIGQVVEPDQGEKISYRYCMDQALEAKNEKAIKSLEKIDHPEYLRIRGNKKWYDQLMIQRKWLTAFGGVVYGKSDLKTYIKIYRKAREYNLFDMIRLLKGSKFSNKLMWPEIIKVNFQESAEKLLVPLYFLQGKHDFNCPTVLVEKYFDELEAPEKELIIFENSAHNPQYEESERFNSWMIAKFKNLEN